MESCIELSKHLPENIISDFWVFNFKLLFFERVTKVLAQFTALNFFFNDFHLSPLYHISSVFTDSLNSTEYLTWKIIHPRLFLSWFYFWLEANTSFWALKLSKEKQMIVIVISVTKVMAIKYNMTLLNGNYIIFKFHWKFYTWHHCFMEKKKL